MVGCVINMEARKEALRDCLEDDAEDCRNQSLQKKAHLKPAWTDVMTLQTTEAISHVHRLEARSQQGAKCLKQARQAM